MNRIVFFTTVTSSLYAAPLITWLLTEEISILTQNIELKIVSLLQMIQMKNSEMKITTSRARLA